MWIYYKWGGNMKIPRFLFDCMVQVYDTGINGRGEKVKKTKFECLAMIDEHRIRVKNNLTGKWDTDIKYTVVFEKSDVEVKIGDIIEVTNNDKMQDIVITEIPPISGRSHYMEVSGYGIYS